jgi:hypothetical protein
MLAVPGQLVVKPIDAYVGELLRTQTVLFAFKHRHLIWHFVQLAFVEIPCIHFNKTGHDGA